MRKPGAPSELPNQREKLERLLTSYLRGEQNLLFLNGAEKFIVHPTVGKWRSTLIIFL